MKKFAVLALICVMAVAVFAACSSDDNVEITFGWWGGDFRAEQTQQVIDMFVEQSDDVYHVEPVVAAWGDYWDMMLTRAAAGDLPDVMQQDVSRLIEFTNSNLLVDLRPFINDHRIDLRNVPNTAIETGKVPGSDGIYAIPIGMNVIAMTYNATLLAELGLQAPLNMTLDQFIQLNRDIYAQSGVRTNWIGSDPSIQMEVHLRAQGVNLFEGASMGGTWENYVPYFALIRQGIEEGWHITPEALAGRDGADMAPMWYPPGDENANLRQWNDPVWSNMLTGAMNDSPDWMEIGMTTFPSTDPVRSSFGRASMFLSMTTQSDEQDAAAEFISYWMNSVDAHALMLGERGVIVNPVVAAAVSSDLSEAAVRQSEFVAWTNDGNSSPFFAGRPEGAAEVVDELRRLTDLVATLQMTPEDAAQAFFAFGNATVR